jgi:hypothetical protein
MGGIKHYKKMPLRNYLATVFIYSQIRCTENFSSFFWHFRYTKLKKKKILSPVYVQFIVSLYLYGRLISIAKKKGDVVHDN